MCACDDCADINQMNTLIIISRRENLRHVYATLLLASFAILRRQTVHLFDHQAFAIVHHDARDVATRDPITR